MIIEISNREEFETILKSGKPVLADFWASWCGPCKMLNPVIDELENENSENLIIAKINVDENFELSNKYSVRSIPMLLLFDKDGLLVRKNIGVTTKKYLSDLVSKVL